MKDREMLMWSCAATAVWGLFTIVGVVGGSVVSLLAAYFVLGVLTCLADGGGVLACWWTGVYPPMLLRVAEHLWLTRNVLRLILFIHFSLAHRAIEASVMGAALIFSVMLFIFARIGGNRIFDDDE